MTSNDENSIADAFRFALQRLVEGKPTNPKLIEKAATGKLRVNVLNVSLEAGHARTLVGHDKCAYPDVRKEILEKLDDVGPRETLKAQILRLRNLASELEDRLEERDSYNVLLLLRLRAYEQGNDVSGKRRSPASKKERQAAMSIVKTPEQKREK